MRLAKLTKLKWGKRARGEEQMPDLHESKRGDPEGEWERKSSAGTLRKRLLNDTETAEKKGREEGMLRLKKIPGGKRIMGRKKLRSRKKR